MANLICQECGGSGGETIPILDYGQGPWEQCGWCDGTGYVTAELRGLWLRSKKIEKEYIKARRVIVQRQDGRL